MKTLFKGMAYPVLVAFLFTAVPALCCCMDIAEAGEPVAHHADSHATVERNSGGHHDHGAHDHHNAPDKNPSHDHSQCEHPQLTGNLANPPALYFGNSDVSFLKLAGESGFAVSPASAVVTDRSHAPPHDLGPPGPYRFPNTPLYLQISVLLI